MDSSRTLEDDTIRDQMEGGYVATRPRFTRARRSWKINLRNLLAEDVRAIDQFVMSTAARGGNAFLSPNLIPNGSFELPAENAFDLVHRWNLQGDMPAGSAAISAATIADGQQSLALTLPSATVLEANASLSGQLACDKVIAAKAGESYIFSCYMNASLGNQSACTVSAGLSISYLSSTGAVLSTESTVAAITSSNSGALLYGYQFNIPTGATAFTIALCASFTNNASSALVADGSASVVFDHSACALCSPLTPYGRMAGSAPLGCLTRFSKLPEISDIGIAGGVKRYGAAFELTEV